MARRRAEVERLEAELEESRPYLALAREIHEEVTRLVGDPTTAIGSVTDALDRLPTAERLRLAEAAFLRLPAQDQWEILARLFDDDELRAALAAQRERRSAEAGEVARREAIAAAVQRDEALDLRSLPAGERLTLGLFREEDVAAGRRRGAASATVARRVLARTTGGGVLHVLEDTFNPAGGLFVTPEYDEGVWRSERLAAHTLVRLGSVLTGREAEPSFEPVLYPCGRVDAEVGGTLCLGRLHAGYLLLGDVELFAGTAT